MQLQGNSKALLAGISIFVLGQLLSGVLIAESGDSSGGDALSNLAWLLAQFSGYIVAILAGATAAFLSMRNHVFTGISVALFGTLVLLVPALVTGRQGISFGILAMLMFGLFAWLGAIIGKHVRTRSGT